MSIMYDDMFFKKFASNHGVPLVLAYVGSFATLIAVSRSIGIKTGLPGDILIKNNELDEVLFFLPITSSLILGVTAYLTYRIFIFFKSI